MSTITKNEHADGDRDALPEVANHDPLPVDLHLAGLTSLALTLAWVWLLTGSEEDKSQPLDHALNSSCLLLPLLVLLLILLHHLLLLPPTKHIIVSKSLFSSLEQNNRLADCFLLQESCNSLPNFSCCGSLPDLNGFLITTPCFCNSTSYNVLHISPGLNWVLDLLRAERGQLLLLLLELLDQILGLKPRCEWVALQQACQQLHRCLPHRARLVLQSSSTEFNDSMLPRQWDTLVLAEPAPAVKHMRPDERVDIMHVIFKAVKESISVLSARLLQLLPG